MKNRNLIISVVIGIVLILALVLSFSGLTGQIVGSLGACSDSDNGIDYYVKGTATYANRNVQYTDYCVVRTGSGLPKWINEYYCSAEVLMSKRYLCENGCENSACIK